jgi:hypothetical protein
MASGRQKARENVDAFRAWIATQTDDDFKQIAHRGQLNRGEVAKAIGIGKSALRQNPVIKEQLEALENELRQRSVLPPLTGLAEAQRKAPKRYDQSENNRAGDSRRLSQLEQENIELKAKVAELQTQLKRYGELSEVLSEFGVAAQ